MSAGRFTATLAVYEIPESPAPTQSRGGYSNAPVTPPRPDPIEVGKVTIRADSLDALKEKIAAHASLL